MATAVTVGSEGPEEALEADLRDLCPFVAGFSCLMGAALGCFKGRGSTDIDLERAMFAVLAAGALRPNSAFERAER